MDFKEWALAERVWVWLVKADVGATTPATSRP